MLNAKLVNLSAGTVETVRLKNDPADAEIAKVLGGTGYESHTCIDYARTNGVAPILEVHNLLGSDKFLVIGAAPSPNHRVRQSCSINNAQAKHLCQRAKSEKLARCLGANKANERVVIVAGAGSTYSDVLYSTSEAFYPPLAKGFFGQCRKAEVFGKVINTLHDGLKAVHNLDIFEAEDDDLEQVFVKVYSDIHINRDSRISKASVKLFLALTELIYLRLLATTTHTLNPPQSSNIGRIIARYLEQPLKPQQICVLTFNYDTYIERVLHAISRKEKYKSNAQEIFDFPRFYGLGKEYTMAIPQSSDVEVFQRSVPPKIKNKLMLLKLHGSLNWFSSYSPQDTPSVSDILDPTRKIRVLSRVQVPVNVKPPNELGEKAYPIIIPPIQGKGAILHDSIKHSWKLAGEKLSAATEVVMFGYSLPQTDYEAIHLFENTIGKGARCRKISLINPDPLVVSRLGNILKKVPVTVYQDTQKFLNDAS